MSFIGYIESVENYLVKWNIVFNIKLRALCFIASYMYLHGKSHSSLLTITELND